MDRAGEDGARGARRMDYFPQEEEAGGEERSYLVLEKDTYFPSGRREAGEAVREEMFERGMREDERTNEVGRNYFPSDRTQVKRRGGRYYIELAIFVDRDLQKDMFENFPDDTDEHIVHVVLAMINAVSDSGPITSLTDDDDILSRSSCSTPTKAWAWMSSS